VRNSLRKLEGVQSVDVDIEFEEAIVRYTPALLSIDAMTRATTDIGFPSSLKPESVTGESQTQRN
jgi:mercuric ion binding protein